MVILENNTLSKPIVYLAADHAGFELKERVKSFLWSNEYTIVDCGALNYDPDDDYTEYMQKAAEELQKDPDGRGLIFGGSGQGEAMTANRYPGIRAVVYYGDGIRVHNGKIYDIIALSREHNNANVLSIGARFVDQDKIFLVVNQWLEAAFSNDERHVRRINKIDRINEVDMPG